MKINTEQHVSIRPVGPHPDPHNISNLDPHPIRIRIKLKSGFGSASTLNENQDFGSAAGSASKW
jgi:hypothetical protein